MMQEEKWNEIKKLYLEKEKAAQTVSELDKKISLLLGLRHETQSRKQKSISGQDMRILCKI